jgi:hypothetical protein
MYGRCYEGAGFLMSRKRKRIENIIDFDMRVI